jgi:hypothetical protein
MNILPGVTMGVRLLIASASLLLMSALPAAADWDRNRGWDRGWNGGGRQYQSEGLKRACHYGDRRACVRLGEVIGRHREARRQHEWRPDRFAMPNRHYEDRFGRPNRYYEERSRYYRPAPPPSFFWRFESR